MAEGYTEARVNDADRDIQALNDILLGEAQKEAAFAIEGAAQAQKENSELKIALAKLQRSTGKRYFSPDEQDQLLKALSKYVITDAVIEFEHGKPEAKEFGEYFVRVFKRLHWHPRTWGDGSNFPPGISIRVVSLSHAPPTARALKDALGNLHPFSFSSPIGQATDVMPGQKSLTYLEVVIGDR
jgi:hypothetical protein